MKNLYILIFLTSFLILSCSNDHEEDLIDEQGPINVVTYQDVKSIFSNNCLNCHSQPPVNGASVPLTNYNFVKTAVENEMLIDRINSQQQGYAMPLGGPKLPQNLIDLIEQWEADGLLEN